MREVIVLVALAILLGVTLLARPQQPLLVDNIVHEARCVTQPPTPPRVRGPMEPRQRWQHDQRSVA